LHLRIKERLINKKTKKANFSTSWKNIESWICLYYIIRWRLFPSPTFLVTKVVYRYRVTLFGIGNFNWLPAQKHTHVKIINKLSLINLLQTRIVYNVTHYISWRIKYTNVERQLCWLSFSRNTIRIKHFEAKISSRNMYLTHF